MPSSGLLISRIQDVRVVSFRKSAILDSVTVDTIGKELYAMVDENAYRKVVLDFSPVRFLSSQMLGVLVTLHKKSINIKGKVVICGLRPDLQKVFKITNLDKVLHFADSEQQALNSFDVLTKG